MCIRGKYSTLRGLGITPLILVDPMMKKYFDHLKTNLDFLKSARFIDYIQNKITNNLQTSHPIHKNEERATSPMVIITVCLKCTKIQAILHSFPFRNCLLGTELLQTPFRSELSMGSLSWYYRQSPQQLRVSSVAIANSHATP